MKEVRQSGLVTEKQYRMIAAGNARKLLKLDVG